MTTTIIIVDLAANPPVAILKNSLNPNTLYVTYTAVVSTAITIKIAAFTLTKSVDNTYTLILPQDTYAVKLISGSSILYSPPEMAPLFVNPDLELILLTHHCNTVSIDTSGLDHTRVQPGEDRVFGHQLGPLRSARAMAMAHIAMAEAFIMYNGIYTSYVGLSRVDVSPSSRLLVTKVAALQAVYTVLISLYPSHSNRLNQLLLNVMNTIPASQDKTLGLMGAAAISYAIIELRANDGSNHAEPLAPPYVSEGIWSKDPISNIPIALGGLWAEKVTPFFVPNASYFRSQPPPALNSTEYMMHFDEVKALGGDAITTPTTRSDEKTDTGIFWAYDGVPSLCAPPRLYNQVSRQILYASKSTGAVILRTLATMNVLMADTGLCCWETKYHYKLWRPVVAVRENTTNTGVIAMPDWSPLGAPASNLSGGVNFSPPFPAYPSGHATFGYACMELLRETLGGSNIDTTFVSDEFNGHTTSASGEVRPYKPRRYENLSQIEEENGDSRIYLGIHFTCDKNSGKLMGIPLASYANQHVYYKV